MPLLAAGLRQLIGDGERRHHGQAGVADLAEGAAQMVDALVELLGELHQMALLPVFAGHPVLPAVDDDIHLGHCSTCDFGTFKRQRSCASITERMLSIATSRRRAISRLVVSISRERAVARSRSDAS